MGESCQRLLTPLSNFLPLTYSSKFKQTTQLLNPTYLLLLVSPHFPTYVFDLSHFILLQRLHQTSCLLVNH
ncbi:hypothetical protein RIF29_37906 [Crotalaria pallida]|uniref:Uncharacterized protein n=1 Tax=Crotalaria pallida TaxID=3830 RepID=A0AAN9HL20_CROPI